MAILNKTAGAGFLQPQATLINKISIVAANTAGYSTESANALESMKTGQVSTSFESAVNAFASAMDFKTPAEREAHAAGILQAGLLSSVIGNGVGYYNLLTNPVSMESGVPHAASYGSEAESFESFDNQAVDQFMNISIGLAYTTGKQSPGMELIYRTIALTPEQGGVDVEVPLLFTQNALQHAPDGTPSDWGFRRIIDASIDDKILRDHSTKIIPMHSTGSAAMFMATSAVTPFEEADGKRVVTTSALKIGQDINLLGLGNLDTVSKTGTADYTEALDRNVGLDKLFMSLGGDTIAFSVLGVPFTRFAKGPEKNGKRLELNVPINSFVIDKNTTAYNDAALAGSIFETIADGNYKVRLKVTVTGNVDLELGVVSVMASTVSVVSITDANNNLISLTTGAGQTIKNGLASLAVGGYTVDAYLTNSNHRYLGLMLNMRSVKERLVTRVRSPIFIPFPMNEERDQTALDWLTFAVLQQKEADGIQQLITYHQRLMDITGGMRGELVAGDYEQNHLSIEGIGRYLVNPYVQTVEVDLLDAQALDTMSAIKNGQEVLLNSARSVFFDVLQHTNYENAARYIDGGQLKHKYQAVFLTTDKLKRFMTVTGDSRGLGAELPYEIHSTVNSRLSQIDEDTDAMYMVLVREGSDIDPLSAGVCLSTPSLVSTLTAPRQNRVNKELVYQPRYAHYNLCPIIVKFEVKGVHSLLNDTLLFKTCEQCVTEVVVPTPETPEPETP